MQNNGKLDVMNIPEIEPDEVIQLVSGHFDMRAEAEAALRKGIAEGDF